MFYSDGFEGQSLFTASRFALCRQLLLDDDAPALALSVNELGVLVARAQAGAWVMKFGRSGRPLRRFLSVSSAADSVSYSPTSKRAADCTVAFADVDAVLAGEHTSVFAGASGGAAARVQGASLSLVAARGPRHSLDVSFADAETAREWHTLLTALVIRARAHAEVSDVRSLKRDFLAAATPSANAAGGSSSPDSAGERARVDHAVVLSRADAESLLAERLAGWRAGESGNAAADDTLRRRVSDALSCVEVDESDAGAGSVSFQSIVRAVDVLRAHERADVRAIFNSLVLAERDREGAASAPFSFDFDAVGAASEGAVDDTFAPRMTVSARGLLEFLVRVQGETGLSLRDSVSLCRHFDPPHHGDSISLPAFSALLLSPANAAFAPAAAEPGWCALTHPLCD